ncbi:SDR family NAD(P)-dependent oxidoreductase [Sphingobacterium kitahiroshimense]|nr:SDR family NAD(P)-dependent oxidoreductase [Sphingobacterium sp. B16(2022)]
MKTNKSGIVNSNLSKEIKVALVTGANQGIGFQIAKALAGNGYIVYLGCRDIEKGYAAATTIGNNARAVQLDVTDATSVYAAVQELEKDFGYLTLLVNNAGISHAGIHRGTLEEMMASQRPSVASIAEMRTVWETNVFAVLSVTQSFLPLIRQAENPRIVNVSSGLGSLTLNADPNSPWRNGFDAIYGASKAALNALTLSLSIELEAENIKVNAVTPGFTATALNNFQGTDSIEVGSLEPIRVALEEDGPTGKFTGPNQEIFPW